MVKRGIVCSCVLRMEAFPAGGRREHQETKEPKELARLRVLIKATSPAGPFPDLYRQLIPAEERRLWWNCLQAAQGTPGVWPLMAVTHAT